MLIKCLKQNKDNHGGEATATEVKDNYKKGDYQWS